MEELATIREDVLRDPRYPVHTIADRLMPYLQVLVEQFQPQCVILFGSYADGEPHTGSDVDLLVVKNLQGTALEDALRIRKAWRPVHRRAGYLSVHLLLQSPRRHEYRLAHAAGFYDTINQSGLRLA
jgi:predicted nucleotidyltransferase